MLAEGLVRFLRPEWRPSVAERAQFWIQDRDLGWAHSNGASGRYRGPAWDVEVRINERGLRDGDHDYERSRKRRVLLLGDSFAWGYGVGQEEMITARLQALCPNWEFINGAVSGYGTDQQYLFYKKELRRYDPDQVVLLICRNDLLETSCPVMYGYPKPYFVRKKGNEIELRNVPAPDRTLAHRLHAWLTAHSFLWSRLGNSTGLTALTETSCSGRVDVELNKAVLHNFVAELRGEGVDFLWALIRPVSGRGGFPYQFYSQTARQEGVPMLDLGPVLVAAEKAGKQITLRGNPHWNAAGHQLAAEALAGKLACAEPADRLQ